MTEQNLRFARGLSVLGRTSSDLARPCLSVFLDWNRVVGFSDQLDQACRPCAFDPMYIRFGPNTQCLGLSPRLERSIPVQPNWRVDLAIECSGLAIRPFQLVGPCITRSAQYYVGFGPLQILFSGLRCLILRYTPISDSRTHVT